MRRPVPVALAILCTFIVVCACGGLLSSAIRLALDPTMGTALPMLLTVPLGGLGLYAALSGLRGTDEAHERLVTNANAYRGVALLFALFGVGALIVGVFTDPQLTGSGCFMLAGATLSLVWYRVIRAVLHRKEVLDAYGLESYG